MIVERDLPVPMDDGAVLRADVYRPETTAPVPVIMTHGPYGKGVMYQEHYKAMWDWLIGQLPGSSRSYLTWETVNAETWVPWGYAVVRVDSRGAGRSAGYLDIFSPRETLDYYHAIEWAGVQPWSNGRVGLNGISYYAINQWHVAALQPPHLTAMVPWEGAADMYRDWYRHGGILSNLWRSGFPDRCWQFNTAIRTPLQIIGCMKARLDRQPWPTRSWIRTTATLSPTLGHGRWMTTGIVVVRRTGPKL